MICLLRFLIRTLSFCRWHKMSKTNLNTPGFLATPRPYQLGVQIGSSHSTIWNDPSLISIPTPITAPYHINAHIIKQCLQHKDLGIVMSHDLSWTNLITDRADKNLDYYARHSAQLTVFLLRNLYTYLWSDLNLFIALKFGVLTKLKTSSF